MFLKAGFVSVSVVWFFALCLYNSKRSFSSSNYILWLPILLFGLMLMSCILGGNSSAMVDMAMKEIYLLLIPLGFILVDKKVPEKTIQNVLFIFLLLCIVGSVFCILLSAYNMIRYRDLTLQVGDRSYFYFTSYLLTQPVNITPVYFSMFCNFGLFIALTTPYIKHIMFRILSALYLVFFVALIAFEPGVICAVIIVITWLVAHARKRLVRFGLIAAPVVILGFVFYNFPTGRKYLLDAFKFDYQEPYGTSSALLADRLVIWSVSLETARQQPLLGYGVGKSQEALDNMYYKKNYRLGAEASLNPHNQFLSVFLDVGVAGVLLLTAILFVPLVLSARRGDWIGVGFILIATFFFFVESVLVRQKGIVFFAFFYSLMFCVNRESKDSK
jgi:O-antigen ligase